MQIRRPELTEKLQQCSVTSKKQLFKSRVNKYRNFKFSIHSFNVPALKFCPRSAEITINEDDKKDSFVVEPTVNTITKPAFPCAVFPR